MAVIPFIEVMRQAETGEPFSIGFFTADYKRKTGGEYLEFKKVRLKSLERSQGGKGTTDATEKQENSKKPRHYQNDTRLLLIDGQAKPKKFHPRLMIMFNEMEVLY